MVRGSGSRFAWPGRQRAYFPICQRTSRHCARSEVVGRAKARTRRAHHRHGGARRWARFALPTLRSRFNCQTAHRHCERSNPDHFRGDSLDCFVASLLAMTVIGASGCVLATRNARALPSSRAFSNQRAQGMPDALRTRSLACNWKNARKQVTTGVPKQSGIPCAMGYGLWRALPGVPGLIATVASGSSASLDPSVGGSGPHDFAVRADATRLSRIGPSIASRAHVRDDRDTPLWSGAGRAGRYA
jgi:hypothetical protein